MERQSMKNGKIRAIVFDFDGTLAELHIDFREMKRAIGRLAANYLHFSPIPPSSPALEWLEELREGIAKMDPFLANAFQREASSLIMALELKAADRGALFPFTRRVLGSLVQRGVKVAIITRNCERAVGKVFPDLNAFCSVFLAREHVYHVKPHPDHLMRALGVLDISAETALMVGDHPMDIETGRNAGTRTAGVCTGNSSEEELMGSGADWIAADCEKLLHVLTEQKLV